MTGHLEGIPAPDPRSCRLLLVDDNPANLKVLFEALRGANYPVSMAQDGQTALDIAARVTPEIVFLDIQMPGMDGFEVCRRLRERSATAEASVIFLSARTDTETKVSGLDLGAIDYITKPVDVGELLARTRVHLTIRRLRQMLAEANRELERRVAERTAQLVHAERLATLGAIMAGVMHEVRNPLVTLNGYNRLTRKAIEQFRREPGEPALAAVDARFTVAEQAALSLVEILENMLSFARKDAAIGSIDIAAAVSDSQRLIASQLHGVHLDVNPAAESLSVRGSHPELVQVLTNLLANAADAARQTADPRIQLSWLAREGSVELEVRDNGAGVADDVAPNLFRPFFTTKAEKGTGLGLMISRNIVESMGGVLIYAPAPGGGACFTAKLPIFQRAAASAPRGAH